MDSHEPTLYDLFDETSFEYWRRQVQAGVLPTRDQLAALLEANGEAPYPAWLRPLVIMGLRGQLKGKQGRPPKSAFAQFCFLAAIGDYREVLSRLVEEQRDESKARPTATQKGADHKPAHQIAAEQVVRDWRLPMDWRSFLNEVRSEK